MKLARLRLVGFKTFVESTEIAIEPGLTGIVGPNGCGKSNLAEALRWAMGESSFKAMRASGMEDVIFSGSTGRPARNAAEVTLVVDNAERRAPPGFNDSDTLEVTRRIERDSGSAYRVNGREVRARDVQLLFADASTGARSPAFVRQGQIGELIQQKPEARRLILEEAAGISGLHARRHEAELRLKAAEQNLERLDDVTAEIARQLDGLKRQARGAARYRTLSGDIRQAEAQLMSLRWQDAASQRAAAEAALSAARASVAEAAGAAASAAKDQAVAAHRLPALREAAEQAAEAARRLAAARTAIEIEGKRASERIAELTRQLARFSEDKEREERGAAEADDALARLAEETDGPTASDATVAEEAGLALHAAEADLRAAEADLQTALAAQARLAAEQAAAMREQAQRRAEAAKLENDLARARRDAGAARAALDADGALAAMAREADAAQAGLAAAEAEAVRAEQAVKEAEAHEAASAQPAAQAGARLNAIEAEARTLRKFVAAEVERADQPILNTLRVEPGFEAALAAALREDLDASDGGGDGAFWRDLGPLAGASLPEQTEPLAAKVRAPASLSRALAHAGLVDRSQGEALQKDLAPGQILVSRQGDLWRWDGFVVSAQAPSAAARRLEERNRLSQVEATLEAVRREADQANAAREAARGMLRAARENEGRARDALRSGQKRAAQAKDAAFVAERRSADARARSMALDEAQARAEAGLSDARARLAATGIADDQALSDGTGTQIDTLRATVEASRSQVSRARAEVERIAREAAVREAQAQAAARERDMWTRRRAEAAARSGTLIARETEARAELTRIEDLPGTLQERRFALLGEAEAADRARSTSADDLARGETEATATDRRSREADRALGAAREDAARAEARAEASITRVAEVERQVEDAFACPPAGLARIAGEEPPGDMPALEASLERLKRERERLGAVNLRAEDELSEQQASHDRLAAERDDLIAAITRLRQAIGSLNREGRERLGVAFAAVDGHFRALFTTLFDGGSAELQLTNPDDPLEAGLEIVAQPPGKKPQVLTLLSGGEQALTAMALIFAVFLTNPAPICVLDEVDAPLDDANVERFCRLIDEMRRRTETRFLVVTHNPISMARMDRLIGVTMAERGVSQVVSVDLETAERFREAV